MRTYEPLIRLARFRVEELQGRLAELNEARGDLARQVEELAQDVPEDRVAPGATRDGFVAYGSYAQAIIARKQNLRASIEEVDAEAALLRSQAEDAAAELARYEAIEERRLAAAGSDRETKASRV
jgi:chromosome segregation ATPase